MHQVQPERCDQKSVLKAVLVSASVPGLQIEIIAAAANGGANNAANA